MRALHSLPLHRPCSATLYSASGKNQISVNTNTVTVIIGAGQAGCDLATALRQQGYAGRIILLGEEQVPPCRRPSLSKAYLSGDIGEEALYIKPRAAYAKQDIDLRADKPNVHYVRTLEDINRLCEQFAPGRRLVIIGGGYIGLEAAAVGIKKELAVTLVEALPRLPARVTGPELSQYYAGVHRRHGVDIRLGAGVEALEGGEQVEFVVLQDGTRRPADLVIVGIGLVPNTELAEQAGLEVDNGIIVDLYAQTSDPDIVAAGDCTNHHNGFLGRRLRLESVPNASEQGRVAAASICGQRVAHAGVPWFWSDQYDLELQMVGLSQGHDRVVIRSSMEADPATLADETVVLKSLVA